MQTSKNNVYVILLGSNIDPQNNLIRSLELLQKELVIQRISRVYESPPHGMGGDNFLNVAVEAEVKLSPDQLKNQVLRNIESRLGRIRTENKFVPRTIDLDIVIINDAVVDNEIFEQPHVCLPVSDLLPELRDSSTGESIKQIAAEFTYKGKIHLRTDIQMLPNL